MPLTAFSSVACPDWTLEAIVRAASEHGYQGVELRTFGYGSAALAHDPALTAPAKVRRLFSGAGVHIACLATGARFDEPIRPPVIGRLIGDFEKAVRQAKVAIDLAAQIECPLVRVFGFEAGPGEARPAAVRRIAERLAFVVDAARNTGVRVVVENGGSFSTAADLAELIDRVGHPLLGGAYCPATGIAAGDPPARAPEILGPRLWHARVKDYGPADPAGARRPCPLGTGEVPNAAFVGALAASGYRGWVVFEWDRLWLPDLAPGEAVLASGVQRIFEWSEAAAPAMQPA